MAAVGWLRTDLISSCITPVFSLHSNIMTNVSVLTGIFDMMIFKMCVRVGGVGFLIAAIARRASTVPLYA